MKKDLKMIICLSVIILLSIVTAFIFFDTKSEIVSYDANEIKKIAYDNLSVDVKSKIVTSLEDYHANEEAALNVENIWLYASCEEIKIKDCGIVLWVDEDTRVRYDTFRNRNKIVLAVRMDTALDMLDSVGLYIDPVNLEVIGHVVTY